MNKQTWIPVASEEEARLYYTRFGSVPLKLGVNDMRERHLVYADKMMAVDDGGGSPLDNFYSEVESLPYILVDLDSLRQLMMDEIANEITNIRNQLMVVTDEMPMTKGDMHNITTIIDRLWNVQEKLRVSSK